MTYPSRIIGWPKFLNPGWEIMRAAGRLVVGPQLLFRDGQDGWIHEPWDLNSLWMDEARTVNPSLPGDVVWWIDDKSPNQNHFAAVSSAARGQLYRWPASAVLEGFPRNRLRNTESLETWGRSSGETSVETGIADPFGGNSAYRVTNTGAGAGLGRLQSQTFFIGMGATVYPKVWVRRVEGSGWLRFHVNGVTTSNLTDMTTEWQEVGLEVVTTGDNSIFQLRIGNAGAVFDVFHPRVDAYDGGNYQRVGSGVYDVSEDGQPDCWSIRGDGVTTQYISSRGIPLFSDNKLRACAGFINIPETQTSNAVILTNANLSSTENAIRAYIQQTDNSFRALYRTNSTNTLVSSGELTPPVTALMEYKLDAPSGTITIRRDNNPPVSPSPGEMGTINSGSWSLFAFRNGSNYFNGLYCGSIMVAEEPNDARWQKVAREYLSKANMGDILGV